jgi:hypothetical protein
VRFSERAPASHRPQHTLPSVDTILRHRVNLSDTAAGQLRRGSFHACDDEQIVPAVVRSIRAGNVVGTQSSGRVLVGIERDNRVLVLKRTGRAWLVLTALNLDEFLARKATS